MAIQRTYDHILNFSKCLIAKGYNGQFLSTFGYTDKIQENLLKHVLQCMEEKKKIGPFNLTTYSKWESARLPYVRCNFFTDYREPFGFDVMKMNIEYGNEFGKLRSKELFIKNQNEIPSASEANAMMIEKKKGLKI